MATAKVTARGIASAMAAMGAQGIGVSPYDLAAGADFLRKLATEHKLPLLSANLVRKGDEQPFFTPYRIVNIDGTRIALIGLTGPLQNPSDTVSLRPWQEILPSMLRELKTKSDLILLLSSMPRKINEQIGQQYKNIHIIIQSGQFGGNLPPKIIENTLFCQTGAKGKYLGILDISWNASHKWQHFPQQDPATLQSRLDRIVWQLRRMEKRYRKQDLTGNSYHRRLEKEKKQLEQTLAALQNNNGRQQRLCTFRNTFLAMETALPEDTTVRAIIDKTRREVNLLNRQRQQKQRLTNEIVNRTFAKMAGEERCTQCHPSQAAFFRRTDHARAWQTLTRRDQQYNPDCIACHATLPEYTGTIRTDEALLTALPARFYNVGCEACHGPSRAHAESPETVLPRIPVAMTCKQCHTAKRDPQFDFSRKKAKIQCPAG